MYERGRDLLLRALKVPPEPHPPAGDPASIRIFRAGRNFFRLRLAGWGLAQAFALAGIVFWAVMFVQVDQAVRARREGGAVVEHEANRTSSLERATNDLTNRQARRVGLWTSLRRFFVELVLVLPAWALPLLWLFKFAGFALYLLQVPVTYAMRRLDYEMHWYIVTDRSLRLRTGVWKIQELTMSFANLQQVEVTQGPLQRLLGLADVRVQSAGGSALPGRVGPGQFSLHTGFFHGVEHADEIRDLILERLRRFRDSGLGDPDDIAHRQPMAPTPSPDADTVLLAAARELRDEARALHGALSRNVATGPRLDPDKHE
ncbi:MAG TPA: PH domain-containing protein [Candidatus Didemnitutus sp.]|jgi:membrane protein YdbS with pleckstrin-like domain